MPASELACQEDLLDAAGTSWNDVIALLDEVVELAKPRIFDRDAGALLTAHQIFEKGILIDRFARSLDHHIDDAAGKAEG